MGLGDIVDGVKGGINKGLSAGEDLIDEGKKKVGEGVDYATNKVGDGLDHVGLHGAADAVEDWGDDVASDLGATPGEQQLGQTEEANELVHGNPDKIRESAKHLKDFHTAFDHVSQGMKKVDSSGWAGEGGDAFRKKFGVHPTKWAQASDACDKAAGALDAYADTVKWAQGKAKEAVELYKKGQKASKDAVDTYNKKVDAYNARIKANEDPGAKPEPFQDPGKADIEKAHETLAEARKQRNTAASDAQGKVKAALAHAPAEPPPLDRLGNDLVDGYQAYNTELTHVVGGALKGTAGLLNFARGLNPTDPYNLTHPAAYMQNVSMTLSGLVSTAAHPERIVTAAVDGFKKDPSEFVGRLLPELIGTKGAGLARGGLRLGLKKGMEEGAETGVRRATRDAERHAEPDGQKKCNGTDPVDLATGLMYLPQTDVELPGALPLAFTRRAESGYELGRWFGPSWSSTLDQRLEIDAQGVVFVTEDGLLLVYPHPAPGVPVLPSHGPRRPLNRVDSGYTVSDPGTGRVWHFADRGERSAVIEQIDDRNGNWITFEYDSEGTPLTITSSGGHRLVCTVSGGRVRALALADAAGGRGNLEIKRYGYSDEGHLTEVFNSSGLPLRFSYDERGRITSWTDTNDRSYTYEYDERDRCVAEGGAEGHMALRLAYAEPDPRTGHRVTTTTTGEGHTRRFLVDASHRVIAETDPLGATTHYRRDRFDRLLSRTDPLGNVTAFRYDEAGNLIHVVRADGREARAEYNQLGLPVKVTNPDGTTWRQTYDERGNRLTATTPAGATTHFTYDAAGRLTSVVDPLGATTAIRCDRAGLPVEVTDPLGATTTYERDAFGRPVAVRDPLGATTRLEWNTEGRLLSRTAPDGSTETWSYDGEGNCTTHTDAVGNVTRSTHTHFDLTATRTTPDGAQYTFTHDSELRLTGVTNPQGLTWRYEYDSAGWLVRQTDFDGRSVHYEHDAAGRMTARTNALGHTVRYVYDELGRVVRKETSAGATTFAYDLTGRLARSDGPDSSIAILRDRFGRVRSETVDGRVLSCSYDELGRRTGRTTPSGAESAWTYDVAGRSVQLTTAGRDVGFAYDAAGHEIGRRVGTSLALANSFDELGRLTTQSVTASGEGRCVQRRAYTYRADGHLLGVEDLVSGTQRFELDVIGRVTGVEGNGWSESYAYDLAGNLTAASWPKEHPGHAATGARSYSGTRLTRAGRVHYEHDALGRVTVRRKRRLSGSTEVWRYEWDPEDRLVSTVTPDGRRWQYTYDALGRRSAKTCLAPDGETVIERTVFTWDGTNLCEQVTMSPELPRPVALTWDHAGQRPLTQTERVLAPGSPGEERPMTPQEVDSRFFAMVTDLVGTPTELIDESGDIAWRRRSTVWGTTAWASDSSTYTPLRFPGQYFDPESGLHYNYFRHYDPETARYVSPDPLGLTPAPNPSSYVDNPHTWSDPLGLAPECPPKGEHSNPFERREDAERAAFEVAGVPYGAAPDAEWVVMGDKTLKHMPGHVYSKDPTHWGNFRQFETPDGSRVVVEHTHDPAGPHFHAGAPKGFTEADRSRDLVNFGWDNTREGYSTMERYRALDKPGGDHHFFHKNN
ncbi:putative T7SS-secreted protein [Streptomyces sp. NPDC055400]